MKKWLLATRPWSFTASVIPLTLGAALAWASDAAHAGLFLLTLLGGVAVQTGTNMLNTYGDYRSGVDTEASAHGESLILLGLISPEAMRRGGLIALCVAFAVGIVLGSPAAGRSLPSASWGLRAATATPAASGLTNTMPAARLWCSCSWGRSWRFPPTTSREAPLTGGPFSPPCLLRASSPASCTPTTSATSRTTARPGSRLSPCCWAAGKPCTCTRPCA